MSAPLLGVGAPRAPRGIGGTDAATTTGAPLATPVAVPSVASTSSTGIG